MVIFYIFLDGVPATARAIKVTNIQSPYVIRVYDIVEREKRINKIDAQLCAFINVQTVPMKNDMEYLNVDDVRFLYFIGFKLYRMSH